MSEPAAEVLFLRLYLDRHIKKQLALDLRQRGFDVLSTEEAGKNTAADEEQLAFAEPRAIRNVRWRPENGNSLNPAQIPADAAGAEHFVNVGEP